MPFIARLKSTGKRVEIDDYRNPKFELSPEDLECQHEDCRGAMLVKAGLTVRSHFAHRPNAPCSTRLDSHPESDAHRLGKATVREWLRHRFEATGFENVTIELEVGIPEARRIADVLVTFPGGMREAHEIQLASITPQELEQRTQSYLNAGIDAFWWIGRNSQADSMEVASGNEGCAP